MNTKNVSILGLIENVFLSVAKLLVGFFTGSLAVLAEGIHSAMDVFSSLVAWWGIKKASVPPDKEHPYGHLRYETIAGFMVTFFLFIAGIWIIFDAFRSIFENEPLAQFSYLNVAIMFFSFVINEIMARLKFKIGNEAGSLALVADARHDRADVVASGAIILGLVAVRWFSLADILLALAVGIYIIYESFGLAKESVELLADTANLELEERIGKFLRENGFSFSGMKTRKIGNANFSEIELLCNSDAKVQEVDVILQNLEKKLLDNFPELIQVSLSVKSHKMKKNTTRPRFWGKFFQKSQWKEVNPQKKGFRVIVPFLEKNGEKIVSDFSSQNYLVLDFQKGHLIKKEIIENSYYKKEKGYGVRFSKSVQADMIFASSISDNALERLKSNSIWVRKIKSEKNIREMIEEISKMMEGGDFYAKTKWNRSQRYGPGERQRIGSLRS